MMEFILSLYVKNCGHWDDCYEDVRSKKSKPTVYNYKGNDLTFLMDDNYPSKLKEIIMPAFFLFHYGNMNLLESNNVIGFNFSPSLKDLENLINLAVGEHNPEDVVICMPSKFINLGIIGWIELRHYKLIVIHDEQLENFRLKDCLDLKNHLLISEFNHLIPEIKKCDGQHIERLLFAFSNHLFIYKTNGLLDSNKKLAKQLDNCVGQAKNKKLVSCHFVNNVLVYTEEEFVNRDLISETLPDWGI